MQQKDQRPLYTPSKYVAYVLQLSHLLTTFPQTILPIHFPIQTYTLPSIESCTLPLQNSPTPALLTLPRYSLPIQSKHLPQFRNLRMIPRIPHAMTPRNLLLLLPNPMSQIPINFLLTYSPLLFSIRTLN